MASDYRLAQSQITVSARQKVDLVGHGRSLWTARLMRSCLPALGVYGWLSLTTHYSYTSLTISLNVDIVSGQVYYIDC